MHAYIVLSLLCGLRTEEARALRWAHVHLDGDPEARPPVPPHVAVWRSVRAHGETLHRNLTPTNPWHQPDSRRVPAQPNRRSLVTSPPGPAGDDNTADPAGHHAS